MIFAKTNAKTQRSLHLTCKSKRLNFCRKQAIESNEKFSFLRESVSKVPPLEMGKTQAQGVKRKQKEKEKKYDQYHMTL